MKYFALTVLLAVMQASSLVPRKAANDAAGTAANVQSKNTTNQAKTPPSPVSAKADGNGPAKSDSGEQHPKNDGDAIIVRQLPSVRVNGPRRDWADWGTRGLNLLLAVVGALQVLLLCWTLRVIRRQAQEMLRQRILMRKQWREMSQQTGSLKEYVADTKKIAQSTIDSTALATKIALPTLKLEKFEIGDVGIAGSLAFFQFPKFKITVKNWGQSPAFLKWWSICYTCEELPELPKYGNQKGSGIPLEKQVVAAGQSFTLPEAEWFRRQSLELDDAKAVVEGRKRFTAYGHVCYGDIFDNPLRRAKFCETLLNVNDTLVFEWTELASPPAYVGDDECPIRGTTWRGINNEQPNNVDEA